MDRNATIFDRWWCGESASLLSLDYGISRSTILRIVNRESNNRGFPRFSIVKRMRIDLLRLHAGSIATPPQTREELKAIVLKAYELNDN